MSCVFDELGSDANRKKIAVTKSDGTTECYVEIERWVDADETAWLWVKVPDISSTVDTDLYLYYDSAHADNTAYVGDTGSTPAKNVWDAYFRLVLHMGDDPDVSHVKDSTSYNNHGTKKGANEPIEINGKIGKAQDLDGLNDHINLDEHIGDFAGLSEGTLECWHTNHAWPQGANMLITVAHKADAASDAYLFTVSSDFHYQSRENGSPLLYLNAGMTPGATTWYYYVMGVDGSGGKLYVDAIEKDSDPATGFFHDINDLDGLRIGNRVDSGVDGYHHDGIIDEVRISSVKRSAAWIKATYETGRDDLLDFGTEETITVYVIAGITRDAAGAILVSCTVWLFRTSDKVYIDVVTSHGTTGAYSFTVGDDTTEHFIKAHKDGTPNVFGTTERDLTGVEE